MWNALSCKKRGFLVQRSTRAKRNPPNIIAHRGFSAKYPENTMLAFEKAFTEAPSDGIELDVQLTEDHELVVFHDLSLKRLLGLDATINTLTLSKLQTLDLGSQFSRQFAGEKIPSLREVFELAQQKSFLVNVELKNYEKTPARRKAFVQQCILLAKEYQVEEQVLFSSFDHFLMAYASKIAPHCKTALLGRNPRKRLIEFCKLYDIQAINPYHQAMRFNPLFAAYCQKQNITINAWTANRVADMLRLLTAGVDSIITNHPDLLGQLLRESTMTQRMEWVHASR